ncbi:hypothetical protein KSP40_PGU015250 [Platanthera guangdongensis]|uniref:Uncharacterized protein n=1 Tax=Platanthera guangdongensis TaxID=2320717 RepID=A0ABR2LF02_9ASPA
MALKPSPSLPLADKTYPHRDSPESPDCHSDHYLMALLCPPCQQHALTFVSAIPKDSSSSNRQLLIHGEEGFLFSMLVYSSFSPHQCIHIPFARLFLLFYICFYTWRCRRASDLDSFLTVFRLPCDLSRLFTS